MGGRPQKIVLVLVAALLVTQAAVAVPSQPATVGFFALRLARSLGFQAGNAAEARAALAGAGVTFTARLADPLTEDEATRLLGQLGVAAEPASNPDRLLSPTFAVQLAGLAARGVLGQGGAPKPEGSLPPSCQAQQRSQCFQCCLAALGPIASVPQRMIDLCNNSCTAIGAPPSSPSSP
jgi:hypothetical protein